MRVLPRRQRSLQTERERERERQRKGLKGGKRGGQNTLFEFSTAGINQMVEFWFITLSKPFVSKKIAASIFWVAGFVPGRC
jgi:hypothetical protein